MALHFHRARSVVNSRTLLRLKIGVRHDAVLKARRRSSAARHHYFIVVCGSVLQNPTIAGISIIVESNAAYGMSPHIRRIVMKERHERDIALKALI